MFDNMSFTLNHMNTSTDEYKQAASRATEEVSQTACVAGVVKGNKGK